MPDFSRALYTDNSRATRDTEELNPIFKICNQNAEPSTTYPLSPSFPCKASLSYPSKFSSGWGEATAVSPPPLTEGKEGGKEDKKSEPKGRGGSGLRD